AGPEVGPDPPAAGGDALVQDLDRDVRPARRLQEPGQPAGAMHHLGVGDESAAALDPPDLVVVLEDSERLAHDGTTHAETARQLGLRWQEAAGRPGAGLDVLLHDLLEL